ncbi:hypothetical protein [Streptomyces canus]|uniref:Pterin-binding domain-containing protein n=1 Tax=Streptomyces canus TaxID=58343 RepID=A0AAW8FGG3_9ACTN|nr:hypothetical protein [Streptomyces canus]MDQ0909241.1 hypothetical protein [Streptomyces canus]MDQ1069283.1 hypothetical protein [Streptomyces canus]
MSRAPAHALHQAAVDGADCLALNVSDVHTTGVDQRCNPPSRALGTPPTTDTGPPGAAAHLRGRVRAGAGASGTPRTGPDTPAYFISER